MGSLWECKYITPPKGLTDHLPVLLTIRGFISSPCGKGVTGLAPDDTGAVLNPRYMLLHITYNGAEPPLTCVTPEHKGKGCTPSTSGTGSAAYKQRAFFDHSSTKFGCLGAFHFLGSGHLAFVSALLRTYGHFWHFWSLWKWSEVFLMHKRTGAAWFQKRKSQSIWSLCVVSSLNTRAKIKHCEINCYLFVPIFSRINCAWCPTGVVFLFENYFALFCNHPFQNGGSILHLCKLIIIYWPIVSGRTQGQVNKGGGREKREKATGWCMMGISHMCNTPDLLISWGGHTITRRAPYPKGMGRGNVLGVVLWV